MKVLLRAPTLMQGAERTKVRPFRAGLSACPLILYEFYMINLPKSIIYYSIEELSLLTRERSGVTFLWHLES
jgi:hypothetical protein